MLTPPQSGTAVFGKGFPLGARFGDYDMHKLGIRPFKQKKRKKHHLFSLKKRINTDFQKSKFVKIKKILSRYTIIL